MDPTSDPGNLLSRCATLAELAPDTLRAVHALCRPRPFAANERLIRQGDPGDSLLILTRGEARAVLENRTGDRTTVGRFGPFEIIGEMALLTSEPRTADVIAETSGDALSLDAEDFHELVRDHPDLGVVLTDMVAQRLGERSEDGLGGKAVGDYRIRRCVGRGGMSIVYEAHRLGDGVDSEDRVALKMMSHNLVYERGAKARFQREAHIHADLEHDNIARVYGQFTAYRTHFIAMEYCDGCDLAELQRRGYRPDDRDVQRIIGQLAAGIAHLHERGVVHRDLKPQNVLVHGDGTMKVTDFGLARSFSADVPGEGMTTAGTLLGTPIYMAPEQLAGEEASPASDVYALGCVVLQVLTGAPPFGGRSLFDLIEQKRNYTLPSRRGLGVRVSRRVYGVLKACLETSPEKRKVNLDALAGWRGPVAIPGSLWSEG